MPVNTCVAYRVYGANNTCFFLSRQANQKLGEILYCFLLVRLIGQEVVPHDSKLVLMCVPMFAVCDAGTKKKRSIYAV